MQPTFASGEICPNLYARVDLAKYHAGLKVCRNFFILPQGGAANRAGTMFVGRCWNSDYPVHLIPFQFSLVQTYVLEFGHQYMRVIMNGGYVLEPAISISGITNASPGVITTGSAHGYNNGDQIFIAGTGSALDSTPGRQYLVANATTNTFTLTDLDGNVINTTNYFAYSGSGGTVARVYTLTTPYQGSDVQLIKWTQSADTVTLCHPSYPPQDLGRTEHWSWTLTEISFAPRIEAPGSVTLACGASGNWSYQYVVTALSNSPPDESLPSQACSGAGAALDDGSTGNTPVENTISWQPVENASLYYIYKANPVYNKAIPSGAMFGYIGQCEGTVFLDSEIEPDFSQAPPMGTNPFNAGEISGVLVTNPGSGYQAGTTITASDMFGTGAQLTPTISNGVPATFSVNAGGSGYTSANSLTTTGGSGTGLCVDITASGGAITAGAVSSAGWGVGYAVNDIVTVVQSGGSGGTLKVTAVSNGAITAVSVANGGENYQKPLVSVENAGSGAAGYIITTPFLGGTETAQAVLTSGGQNYLGGVSVSTASGNGAITFTPVISGGVITKVETKGAGENYVNGDALIFTQAGGSGATFLTSINTEGSYPSCATYFQQRKAFGGSNNQPETIWMTQPADYKNMDVSNPSKASDAITATMAANQVNAIKFMVPMNNLVVMTSGAAWMLMGGYITNPVAVTPSNIVVAPQNAIGCADLPPIVINYDILYVQAKGSIVRDLAYNFYAQVYTGTDMSILSSHLFFGHTLERWCYAEEPFKQVWAVRDDGILLGFTYLKEQDVYAWTRHDSFGQSGTDQFLSVASIPEQQIAGLNVDSVYFVVERAIPGINGGQPVKYVERMNCRNFLTNGVSDVTKAWFLDCALQYDGNPVNEGGSGEGAVQTITGLDHLNGATVSLLADGNVQPPAVVVDGSITLQYPATLVTVGLSYQAQLQSLCMEPEGMAMQVQDYRKKISAVAVRVTDTRGLKVGPDFNKLVEIKMRGPSVPMGTAIPLFTGDQRVVIDNQYLVDDDVTIQQDYPLPCTVLGIIPEVSIGDGPG